MLVEVVMSKKMVGMEFEVVGTGKNAGKRARARVESTTIYEARMTVFNPIGVFNLKAADAWPKSFFFSTGRTAAATKGQTSWEVAPEELERFKTAAVFGPYPSMRGEA
jgi:hypothetical protein